MVGQIKRKNRLKNLLLIVLIVLIGIFITYQFYPTPSKTVRSFFIYLMREEYDKAYNLIDGSYRDIRGDLEKFTKEYQDAVRSGTRTKGVKITGIEKTGEKDKFIVNVTVKALYFGNLVDTNGSYIVQKIPKKGWRIVDNVSSSKKE